MTTRNLATWRKPCPDQPDRPEQPLAPSLIVGFNLTSGFQSKVEQSILGDRIGIKTWSLASEHATLCLRISYSLSKNVTSVVCGIALEKWPESGESFLPL